MRAPTRVELSNQGRVEHALPDVYLVAFFHYPFDLWKKRCFFQHASYLDPNSVTPHLCSEVHARTYVLQSTERKKYGYEKGYVLRIDVSL